MRALTLTQPWASLVAIGAKKIETRSWPTRYRGPLAIHASARFPRSCQDLCAKPPFLGPLAGTYRQNRAGQFYLDEWLKNIPLGAVVAVATLVDCRPTGVTLSTLPFGADWLPAEDSPEYAFGDFSPGRFGWLLENVQRLKPPIPAKGALGVWEWDRAGA